jgi:hypothetical protein
MTTLRVLQQQAVQVSGVQPFALNSMTSAGTIDIANMMEFLMPLMFLAMMGMVVGGIGNDSGQEFKN